MAFNLDGMNRNNERVGYFAYAPGVDHEGNECMMVVRHDPSSSGCNPFYWDVSPYNRPGHEFSCQEAAEHQAKYARGSWSVKSVNTDAIKIGCVHFTVVETVRNMGDVV